VENYFQGIEQGRDGEVVIVFGEGDPRAVDDRNRMKTVLGNSVKDSLDARVKLGC
jgi:hypothetical protein